jgi:hypothetical protein
LKPQFRLRWPSLRMIAASGLEIKLARKLLATADEVIE